MDVLQGGNRPRRPRRYKARILYFWDMPVAATARTSSVALGRRVAFAVLWRSYQSAARCTGVVLLRFPHQVTSRQITLVRSSQDFLYGAETVLTGRCLGARRNSSMNYAVWPIRVRRVVFSLGE